MTRLFFCVCLVTLLGCGANSPEPDGRSVGTASSGPGVKPGSAKELLLAQEPQGVQSVIEIRKAAKDGDDVVVVGRIGGHFKPFTEGRATFMIVDESLKPTFECESPWDYCEYDKKELADARLTVKFVEADGKTVGHGARELFGVKELSTVVVQGKVKRDDKDNVLVIGEKIFVRPETKP